MKPCGQLDMTDVTSISEVDTTFATQNKINQQDKSTFQVKTRSEEGKKQRFCE